jgi:hypothetical protein
MEIPRKRAAQPPFPFALAATNGRGNQKTQHSDGKLCLNVERFCAATGGSSITARSADARFAFPELKYTE